jgi:hypothetical protein
MNNNLEKLQYHFPVSLPYYYDKMSTAELSYWDYLQKVAMTQDIRGTIEKNTDKQIVANAFFTEKINSVIIDSQIASARVLHNNIQLVNKTILAGFSDISSQLKSGFSDISREIGVMNATMSIGFARLNGTVQNSTMNICDRLDEINDILNNPFLTKSRELYRRASLNYNKGFYKEVLEDLIRAVRYNKTDYVSWFLLGKTYLFGLSEFSDMVDLDASEKALKTAAMYIKPDAQIHNEAQVMAAEIWFYLGLAQQNKANDMLHSKGKSKYKKYLEEAKNSFSQSWNYSEEMLESQYNIARCKVSLGDFGGALENLRIIILKDIGYCLKVAVDSDFNSVDGLLDELFNSIKLLLYPKQKILYEKILNIICVNFHGPYSLELAKLIKNNLPDAFNKTIPPFDLLESRITFPKILSLLEEEFEHFRKEEQRKKEEENQRKRQEEQIRKNEEEQRKRNEEGMRIYKEKKEEEKNRLILIISASTIGVILAFSNGLWLLGILGIVVAILLLCANS